MERAGIDRKARLITPHSFRHTLIIFLRGQQLPLGLIQSTVGHIDEKVTDVHTHCWIEGRRQLAEPLDQLFHTS